MPALPLFKADCALRYLSVAAVGRQAYTRRGRRTPHSSGCGGGVHTLGIARS
jgi:hypothetical protein